MAFLIPENIRNDRAVGAACRRVASALAIGLDEAATAWFEPPFDPDGKRPDFVVLDPSLGVIVLMVFDDDMLGSLGGRLRVADAHGERDAENPLEQASEFGMALRAAIAANPRLAMVPVGGVVAFPGIDRAQAEQLGVDSVVNLDHCVFKADLDAVTQNGDEAVLEAARIDGSWCVTVIFPL